MSNATKSNNGPEKNAAAPERVARQQRTTALVQFAVLAALEAVVCFTPLGSIPISGGIVATLSHIPVIIAAIMLGTAAGAGMGFLFGLFSFLVWTIGPLAGSPAAFLFTPTAANGNFGSLLICFVPRILIGVVAGLAATKFTGIKNEAARYTVAGVLGSLVNTVLVVGGGLVFFGHLAQENSLYGALIALFGATIIINGSLEAILGGLSASAVCIPLKKALNRV